LFNEPSTTEIYSLSLHDALPILASLRGMVRTDKGPPPGTSRTMSKPNGFRDRQHRIADRSVSVGRAVDNRPVRSGRLVVPNGQRSEEHTSELQSRENLVCRLLLE